jgi:hypothetical protein
MLKLRPNKLGVTIWTGFIQLKIGWSEEPV